MKRFFEVISVTAILIVLARLLYGAKGIPVISDYYATIFAIIFIYVPVMMLWLRKEQITFLDHSIKGYAKSTGYFAVSSLVIFPPFLICAHFWMLWVFKRHGFAFAGFPDLLKVTLFQILLVALPEEFFFRGYMQTTFDQLFRKRWNIFGASLGWAWPLTAIIFAFCHSFVRFQWWHFSIFFPALVFGWLREKTGTITAPILFHALSNIASDWIARCYF